MDTVLVVHPVQRDLAAIRGADELAEGQEMLCYFNRGNTHTLFAEYQNDEFFCFFPLLAVINWGSGLNESADHRLQPPSPAPRGRTEALGHRRAVLVEKNAEGLVGNQEWGLAKQNDDKDSS